MNLIKSPSSAALVGAPGRRLQVGGQVVTLDAGRVYVATWPTSAAMSADIKWLCGLASPTIRYAGGVLISDISLEDNLMAEPSLLEGALPTHLMPEIETLFGLAGSAVASGAWRNTFPDQADALAVMQVQVGRALAADPDLLLVDATHWDDIVLQPARFSQSFVTQFPWRTLIWATHDSVRADRLRVILEELFA